MNGRWIADELEQPRAATRIVAGADPVVVVMPPKSSTFKTVLIVCGVAAAIYALSPGARYFYRHGRLPPHPDDREPEHAPTAPTATE